jgi:predicted DCC family thiol-disulfide oxidoreductase YuxK
VRFFAAIDRRARLRYAPLGGETFREVVPEDEAHALPDSLVLRTADGRLLVRSAAVLGALRLAGPGWSALASLGALVPRKVADRVYDLVARIRRSLFAPPPQACPVAPGPLRQRFLP